ncbi:MAG: hydroxymethylbilane synthase [Solirubrobacterales bacterium]
MNSSGLRLGTRGSKLALAQAEQVAAMLDDAEVVAVKTEDGAVGDKARFVRGIEGALLAGEVDIAVHSAKDLPAELPDGLTVCGVTAREDPTDAWVGEASSLDQVVEGARVGTSSLRRRSQLLAARPDLEMVELRGNVDTRLAKLDDEDLDGIVLAAAGLRRLGLEGEIAFRFETAQMTPAPGQGTVALEVRTDDGRAREAASGITEPLALSAFNAERAAVEALGASCNTPVGIVARVDGSGMRLTGFAGLPDGSEWVRDAIEREASDPSAAGLELAHRMKAAGAVDILRRAEALA